MDKLPPPSTLSLEGNLKENWRRFSQAFEIYLIASGINEKKRKSENEHSIAFSRPRCG